MKVRNAIGTVYMSGLVKYSSWLKKSFHVQMNVNTAQVPMAGFIKGSSTWKKMRM